MKESLYLSGTINITTAILLFEKLPIYSIILLLIGAINFIIAEKNANEQYKIKTLILTLSLINLILNPISGIISLIGNDKLNKENIQTEIKPKEKKESTKLDNLLKIGVSLVTLSGIIFATTNWNIITNITKIILLMLFSIFFIILSLITEKKLKLNESSKGYWLLGMLFIILTVVATIYFEIIPLKTSSLSISMTTIITSLLSFITYKKYNKLIYKNITFIGIITSFATILMHLELSLTIIMTIVTTLFILINYIKPNTLTKYLTYSSVIVSTIYIKEFSIIEFIILTMTSIINLIIITKNEKELEGTLTPILINILIIKLISQIDQTSLEVIISLIIYSIIYIIKIQNKTYTKLMNIATNIAFIIMTLASLDDNVLLLITTSTITLTSLINYDQKQEKILLPIKTSSFLLAIIYITSNYLSENILKLILVAIYTTIFIIYKLIKNKNIKLLSIIMYYILFYISLITNDNNTLISILNIATSIIMYIIINKENNKHKTVIAYITILITLLFTITNNHLFTKIDIINYITLLLSYIFLTILNIKNETYKKINSFAIILPLLLIIQNNNQCIEINEISKNILGMYIIILLNTYLLKQQKDKQILLVIITSTLLASLIFTDSWIIGIYIGIISTILIIYGFIKKEYKGLYIEGIIIMIINIIYQFKYLWKEIPLWLYLLLSGLILIGIVTYKELKENKRSSEK